MLVLVVNIRLHVLTYGSQIIESQGTTLSNDIKIYSNFMESALNSLSRVFEMGPKEDCPTRTYHIEFDPDTHTKFKEYNQPFDEWKKSYRPRVNGANLLMPIVFKNGDLGNISVLQKLNLGYGSPRV